MGDYPPSPWRFKIGAMSEQHTQDEHGWAEHDVEADPERSYGPQVNLLPAAEPEPVRPCPVCGELYPYAGPDGTIPHVLDDHPDSLAAQWVRAMLSRAR